ncbi:hypothetical protein [Cryptosporangium minutisporangium]|uniref:Uncharacterized protein n=1 Tax=Cryptosporangium minutisporangium TaxID=113569 RepID=A0ABP6T501_9ACTN
MPSLDASAPPTVDGTSSVLEQETVAWAVGRLRSAAPRRGDLTVVLIAADDGARLALEGLPDPLDEPESYTLWARSDVRVVISAADERGFAYALTELAERLTASPGLEPGSPEQHRPAVPIRGIARAFSSVEEDLPWFRDRRFWLEYLDFLAAQRFNRFHLALGMQYNYGTPSGRHATDNYLCFSYPFLLDVPGSGVRVQGLSEQGRDDNFAALAFIARECRRRGLSFQLGLWNHAYDYGWASEHTHPVLGLARQTHAEYCAAALGMLLEKIPEIDGLTLRLHYEGGIFENERQVFWERIFRAVSDADRPITLELHAKGVDQALLDAARKPNLTPMLSFKYWAEHLGLPYHQASIRAFDRALPVSRERLGELAKLIGITELTRRFTRYGYADFLDEDRDVEVMFRVWPGTQKLLLWGDPALAAGYGRYATFGGSRGVEFSEPLFFKGRKGSGVPGGREVYARDGLRLGAADWRKYRYTYLLWGRLTYDPDARPETWQRLLRADYGDAAADVEQALASLSRILPLVTVVHAPSVSNNVYSPETYRDVPLSAWVRARPYEFDSRAPNWVEVGSFDPALFYAVGEYADDALAGALSGRYTPLEVAGWIERFVADGEAATERARTHADTDDPQVQRTLIDAAALAGLGRFFAAKLRAAVDYAFFLRSGEPARIDEAVRLLEAAHAAYGSVRDVTAGVYRPGLAFGPAETEWADWGANLDAMADDLRALRLERDRAGAAPPPALASAPARRETRWDCGVRVEVPESFVRSEPLVVRVVGEGVADLSGAALYYRYVDQSKDYVRAEMKRTDEGFAATIPAESTATSYPLMCFAEVRRVDDAPVFVPGFDPDLSNQPYVVVHSTEWKAGRTG